jgi:hypothetical protein
LYIFVSFTPLYSTILYPESNCKIQTFFLAITICCIPIPIPLAIHET